MKLKWTSKALSDLVRLYDFLAPVDKRAATRTVQALTAAPVRLLEHRRVLPATVQGLHEDAPAPLLHIGRKGR